MNTKKYWILVFSICYCVVFLAPNAFCISSCEKMQIEMFGISTLKGLRGMSVKITLLAQEGAGSVTEDALQTKVELELRKAGIKVFSDEDPNAKDPNVGRFCIAFSVNKIEGYEYYYCGYSVALFQNVLLLRNFKIWTRISTWPLINEPKGFGVGRSHLARAIKDALTKEVNEFINDYLAANPKEPVRKPRLVPDDLPKKKKPTLEELIGKQK